MTTFQKDLWLDAADTHRSLDGKGTDLVQVEMETAFFLRDAAGRIVHRYMLPRQSAGWLPFGFYRLIYSRDVLLEMASFKGKHKYALRQCLRKLATHRRGISVLEIGSTIGENYHVLRRIINEDGLITKLSYYGFDIDEDLVAASHVLFGHEPDFFAAVGECEVLASLPSRSADLVTTLGVLNHAVDAPVALGHALRVARVAFVGMIQVTDERQPLHFRAGGGIGADWMYTIFTRQEIDEVCERHGITHRYRIAFCRFDEATASAQDRYYVGVDDHDLPVRLEWVVLAKAKLFPEWEGVF